MLATALDITRTLASLAAVGLVIFGWNIVNRQNNQRETRKELKSMLDDLFRLLEKVTEQAVTFHTSENYNPHHAMTLQTGVTRAVKQSSRLGTILQIDIKQDIILFRQSITRHNFDKTEFRTLEITDQQITEITDGSFIIRDQLETAFQDRFTFNQ